MQQPAHTSLNASRNLSDNLVNVIEAYLEGLDALGVHVRTYMQLWSANKVLCHMGDVCGFGEEWSPDSVSFFQQGWYLLRTLL